MQTDAVDKILEQWQRERPDLDASPMGVIGRLSRLSQHIDHAIQAELAPLGITPGEFDVLATLRRCGTPYQLKPTLLYRALMLSSGAMTNRLDRLEQAGYVRRLPDPQDRRGTLVQLTEDGVQLIDRAVEIHIRNEQRMLADLPAEDQEKLARIFSRWLQSFEASAESETKA